MTIIGPPGRETGAGLMRNRCAFTSRDMAADWPDAFTFAIVLGWHDDDHPEDDAWAEIAARYGWDEPLVAFLRDAHERFKALPDRTTGAGDEPTARDETNPQEAL